MKRHALRCGFALMLAVLAGLMSFASVRAHAQSAEVNGQTCPTATVTLTAAGMLTFVPVSCGGSGNLCDNATATFSATGISIQAPPSCLSAGPIPSPVAFQATTINGNPCNSATLTWSIDGIAIDVPPECGNYVPLPPAIVGISPSIAYAGLSVTITGNNFAPGATVTVGGIAATVTASSGTSSLTISIPAVPLGAQPVLVTAGGQSTQATSVNIVAVPVPVQLLGVRSRKVHGTAGTFDLPIDVSQSLGGSVTVEPRRIAAGHVIVFEFDKPIAAIGPVTAVDSSFFAVNAGVQITGNEIAVTLSSVADNRRIRISLAGINGVSSAAASIGFLIGDVNGSRAIDAADLSAVKAFSGQTTDVINFRNDLKASGSVNAADIASVRVRQGTLLGQ